MARTAFSRLERRFVRTLENGQACGGSHPIMVIFGIRSGIRWFHMDLSWGVDEISPIVSNRKVRLEA